MHKTKHPPLLKIKEAAAIAHIAPNSIYSAIRKKRLKAHLKGKRWYIAKNDLDEYRANKFNPSLRKDLSGKPIYSPEEGRFSPWQIAKVFADSLGKPFNISRIYKMIYSGELRAYRYLRWWVIHERDPQEFILKKMKVKPDPDPNQIALFS